MLIRARQHWAVKISSAQGPAGGARALPPSVVVRFSIENRRASKKGRTSSVARKIP